MVESQCLSNQESPGFSHGECQGEILFYQTEDGLIKLDVNMHGETMWLSLEQMAELDRDSVVAKFATTACDRKTYQVDYYNLDVIISVGYRVKSQRGVQFRKRYWQRFELGAPIELVRNAY